MKWRWSRVGADKRRVVPKALSDFLHPMGNTFYKEPCRIWDPLPALVCKNFDTGVETVDSPRTGGKYKATVEALQDLKKIRKRDFNQKLTTWLIDQREKGEDIPKITCEIINNIGLKRRMPINKRIDRLLNYLYKKTYFKFGNRIKYTNTNTSKECSKDIDKDYRTYLEMVAYSESFDEKELGEMIGMLVEKGYLISSGPIASFNPYSESRIPWNVNIKLTLDAIERVESYNTKISMVQQAFIAMWFDQSMDDAYEKAIVPAVEEMGYEPIRIDKKSHNNKIDDEIIMEIKRSRFLVADFSQGGDGARGGVYYEAGFAHGFDIPIIFTCRKEDVEKLHFDTRQFNHIVWKDKNDLKEQLKNRIGATIGDGPLKKSGNKKGRLFITVSILGIFQIFSEKIKEGVLRIESLLL